MGTFNNTMRLFSWVGLLVEFMASVVDANLGIFEIDLMFPISGM
jgi:hypothetical protein